jgi:electron transport complex protein RnfD
MYAVILALIPAFLISIAYFGVPALVVVATSVLFCLFFEFLLQKYVLHQKVAVTDGSAILTGVLLAFNLPSHLPVWMIALGAFAAIGVAKMSFGGLGSNIFNPALVGRVFLLICFPVEMTTWPKPELFRIFHFDAVSGATALAIIKEGTGQGHTIAQLTVHLPGYMDMIVGGMGGSLGEVSAIALVLGGLYLLSKKIITWYIPVSFLATVFCITGIFWLVDSQRFVDPLFHLVSGGLMLGAFFMATDYVTSPMTPKGMLIFGIGCGLITSMIRLFGSYPEGVSFAILIMNSLVPLIDKICKPRLFGAE